MKVEIPFTPREWQLKFDREKRRFSVLVIHRRAGKTVIAVNELIKSVMIKPGLYVYIAPFYSQAKDVAWGMLKYYSRAIPGLEIRESDVSIIYPNGGIVRLYGADNPDRLRGLGIDGCVFDEYSQQPSNIYSEIIRPALADKKGWAMWIGTPKGRNSFYELYEYVESPKNPFKEDWYRLKLTVNDTKALDERELMEAKALMTDDEYEQEFLCSFTASIKGAYYAKEMNKCFTESRIISQLYDKVLPVYTAWDLGISDDMSVLFYQVYGGQIRIINGISDNGKALDEWFRIIDKLSDKYGYRYTQHYFPHDIEVRELGSAGKTRLDICKEGLGMDKCSVLRPAKGQKSMSLMDGINYCRLMFNKVWFQDIDTVALREALLNYQQEWDEKAGMFKDKPLHNWSSHYADAFRYCIMSYKLIADVSTSTSIEVNYNLDPRRSNNSQDIFTTDYNEFL